MASARVDVSRCDVVQALVVALMIVVTDKGFEFIRQTTSRAQAHANDTQPRVCRRAWHKLGVKNKSSITLNSVILRHFVSLSVSLKNTKTQSKTAKSLIKWCPHTDSNRGPIDYKSIALPAEL